MLFSLLKHVYQLFTHFHRLSDLFCILNFCIVGVSRFKDRTKGIVVFIISPFQAQLKVNANQ